jgi:hypothetical protein
MVQIMETEKTMVEEQEEDFAACTVLCDSPFDNDLEEEEPVRFTLYPPLPEYSYATEEEALEAGWDLSLQDLFRLVLGGGCDMQALRGLDIPMAQVHVFSDAPRIMAKRVVLEQWAADRGLDLEKMPSGDRLNAAIMVARLERGETVFTVTRPLRSLGDVRWFASTHLDRALVGIPDYPTMIEIVEKWSDWPGPKSMPEFVEKGVDPNALAAFLLRNRMLVGLEERVRRGVFYGR